MTTFENVLPVTADPDAADPRSALDTVDALLRDRRGILDRIRDGRDLGLLARASIVTIAACTAAFGAAMGAHRGGLQIAFAAVKLPMAVLFTAAVCAPALTALNAAFDRQADARRDLALVLVALALGSLVLSALAPVVLLGVTVEMGYHANALLVVACCGLAGSFGVVLLLRGLVREWRGAIPVALALASLFGAVGSQMTWTLRPWLLRPATQGVPFVRSLEGTFLDAVSTSIDSARGVYEEDAPALRRDGREMTWEELLEHRRRRAAEAEAQVRARRASPPETAPRMMPQPELDAATRAAPETGPREGGER